MCLNFQYRLVSSTSNLIEKTSKIAFFSLRRITILQRKKSKKNITILVRPAKSCSRSTKLCGQILLVYIKVVRVKI